MAANDWEIPSRLYVKIDGLPLNLAQRISTLMQQKAQSNAPKITGRMAASIEPYYGPGFVGLQWSDPAVWYQESGTRPFTMRSLAGKTIPMWIDDPTGKERAKYPKAETRRTKDGRTQVLIFRRVSRQGQRKMVIRAGRQVSVPRSYPGAPGRIERREVPNYPGRSTGRIARLRPRPHVGVRWRHPGIVPRRFVERAVTDVLTAFHLPRGPIYTVNPVAPEGVAGIIT